MFDLFDLLMSLLLTGAVCFSLGVAAHAYYISKYEVMTHTS